MVHFKKINNLTNISFINKLLKSKSLDNNKPIHMFIFNYMVGCPYCEEAKKEWDVLMNKIHGYNKSPKMKILLENTIFIQLNSKLVQQFTHLKNKPSAFPTFTHIFIPNNGVDVDVENNYESTERSVEAFNKWVMDSIYKYELPTKENEKRINIQSENQLNEELVDYFKLLKTYINKNKTNSNELYKTIIE